MTIIRYHGLAPAIVLGVAATAFSTGASHAQGVYAYPLKGQSAEQQHKDKAECHTWAVSQTGFNPSTAGPVATYSAPPPQQSGAFGRGAYGQGGAMGDMGRGAAMGALGGAIAGDAGKGAAVGALAGGLFGGIKRSQADYERQQWKQQQASQLQQQQQIRDQQMAGYNRAYTICIGSKGYAVQ